MFQTFAYVLIFIVMPVAIIGGYIAALSAAKREAEHEDPTADEGIGSARRMFIYVLALVGIIFAAVGVAMIISGAIDAVIGDTLLLEQRRGLAVALSFTVVGAPAWLLFMLLAQRSIQSHEVERRSQARRLYFNVARSVALGMLVWNGVEALRQLLRVTPVEGGAWGALVAWGAVWLIHQRLLRAEPAPTYMTALIDRLALYFGAVLGLLLTVSGAVSLLTAPLSEAFNRAFGGSLLAGDAWSRDLRDAIPMLIVGVVVWATHWMLQLQRADRLTTLWRVYVFLCAALLGVSFAIVSAATVLYSTLEWFLGVPSLQTPAAHFSDVPSAVSAFLVGVAVWGYHRAVLTEAGDAHERSGPERVYRYVLSAAGLLTAAIGVASLISIACDMIAGTPDFVQPADWWRNGVLSGVTLLVVGVPVWVRYWRDTQHTLAAGIEERGAPSRRIYVFGTVGVAIFALLVSLTVVLYQVFQAVLGLELSRTMLRDMDWALGTALTAAAVAYYHFLVLREDQAAMPEVGATPVKRARQVVLVAPGNAALLVGDLERIEGVRVRAWRRADDDSAALSPERRDALLQAVATADADRLLAIVARGDFELVPYIDDVR